MADKKEAQAGTDNELQKMLDKIVENAHARLDMAADILRSAVTAIPPEELAKILFAGAAPSAEKPAADAAPKAEPAKDVKPDTTPAPAAEKKQA